jgi:hypothetical protein
MVTDAPPNRVTGTLSEARPRKTGGFILRQEEVDLLNAPS